jgi:ABC-2 type transport system ATP-binding protein
LQNKEEVVAISDTEFLIHSVDPESIRKQILALTVEKNLNIRSLQTEGNSLEEVFRILTK